MKGRDAVTGGDRPARSTRRSYFAKSLAVFAAAAAGTGLARNARAAAPSQSDRIRDLETKLQQLTQQVGILEDVHAIRRLQHAYGYYMDKCLYEQVVDLFADDGELVFGNGVYKGKAGLRRLYIERFRKVFAGGKDGPVFGQLLDHPQLQDIVDVAPDRRTAQARYRCFMQAGSHETRQNAPANLPQQWWEGGVYENTYVREKGVWKIKRLNYHVVYQGRYEDGWRHWQPGPELAVKTFPENPTGPDEVLKDGLKGWPNTPVVPYHYAHPVTGKRWTSAG